MDNTLCLMTWCACLMPSPLFNHTNFHSLSLLKSNPFSSPTTLPYPISSPTYQFTTSFPVFSNNFGRAIIIVLFLFPVLFPTPIISNTKKKNQGFGSGWVKIAQKVFVVLRRWRRRKKKNQRRELRWHKKYVSVNII